MTHRQCSDPQWLHVDDLFAAALAAPSSCFPYEARRAIVSARYDFDGFQQHRPAAVRRPRLEVPRDRSPTSVLEEMLRLTGELVARAYAGDDRLVDQLANLERTRFYLESAWRKTRRVLA
jgi:hypothetical protein